MKVVVNEELLIFLKQIQSVKNKIIPRQKIFIAVVEMVDRLLNCHFHFLSCQWNLLLFRCWAAFAQKTWSHPQERNEISISQLWSFQFLLLEIGYDDHSIVTDSETRNKALMMCLHYKSASNSHSPTRVVFYCQQHEFNTVSGINCAPVHVLMVFVLTK